MISLDCHQAIVANSEFFISFEDHQIIVFDFPEVSFSSHQTIAELLHDILFNIPPGITDVIQSTSFPLHHKTLDTSPDTVFLFFQVSSPINIFHWTFRKFSSLALASITTLLESALLSSVILIFLTVMTELSMFVGMLICA